MALTLNWVNGKTDFKTLNIFILKRSYCMMLTSLYQEFTWTIFITPYIVYHYRGRIFTPVEQGLTKIVGLRQGVV